jgi:uncharacterized membrane protein YbhN (UPF0104 family)
MTKRSKYFKNMLSLTIVLIIFILLFSKISFSGLLKEIRNMHLGFFTFAILISVIFSSFIGSARLKYILNTFGCKISFRETLFLKIGSSPLGVLPSGKIHFISQIAYLKKYKNFPLFQGVNMTILALILNMCAQLTFFATGILILLFHKELYKTVSLKYFLYIPIITGLFILLLLLVIKNRLINNIILFILGKISIKLRQMFKKFLFIYNGLNNKKLFCLLLYSVIFQLSELIICYILTKSLHINIPLSLIILFVPIIILISNFPVSFGGLGLRELGILLFFSKFGTYEQIISLGIMFSFVECLIPVFVGILFLKPFLYTLV